MKNTKQKLNLSQETVRLLTQEQSVSTNKPANTTIPFCPTCSFAKREK